MQVLLSLDDFKSVGDDIVVAIGVYDGVHKGHRRVIERCHDIAAEHGARPWVMTFDPHPLQVVHPGGAPRNLTSLQAKLERIEQLGIAGCMVVPFTREFADLEPETFLEDLMRRVPGIKAIVVGENWHFGKKARGNVALLRQLAGRFGFEVHIAEPVFWQDAIISSSRIREAVAAGRLEDAREMLGRQHAVRGQVIHGQKRGRRLGFPTANLDLRGYALPPSGIYASLVHHEGRTYGGALYLPSVPEPQHGGLEVHLIDFEGDLYGKILHVDFICRTREDNRRFESENDLIHQIRQDISGIRTVTEPLISRAAP